MMDAGHALAITGNHELNAVAWYGGYRPDTPKNRAQHAAFLAAVGEGSAQHAELIGWFRTLPLWLDLPGFRVVHACWDPRAFAIWRPLIPDAVIPDALLPLALTEPRPTPAGDEADAPSMWHAVEVLTKGLEIVLPGGASFKDKDGHERRHARLRWGDSPPATYRRAGFLPGSATDPRLDALLPAGVLPGYDAAKPLFIGHYWQSGPPVLLTSTIACVDYSAGKGGPLVAYQWRGEPSLDASQFIVSRLVL